MENEILKDCPFCGSSKIVYSSPNAYSLCDDFQMVCQNCDAGGPYTDNEQDAIKLWNERK